MTLTDTKRLREKIKESGIKHTFIADKLGISRQSLSRKLEDGSDFKISQMFILKDMLHLSAREAREIFFTEDVE